MSNNLGSEEPDYDARVSLPPPTVVAQTAGEVQPRTKGDPNKESPVSQVVVAVVIALLAGGSSPWWWAELRALFGEPPETSSIDSRPAREPIPSASESPTVLDSVPPLRWDMPFDVHFQSLSDQLEYQAAQALNSHVALLNGRSDYVISVEGHTNTLGDDLENLSLAERRANAVAVFLRSAGIQPSAIRLAAYGATRPLCSDSSELCNGRNDRVRIVTRSRDSPR